jgi:hypothetical protein
VRVCLGGRNFGNDTMNRTARYASAPPNRGLLLYADEGFWAGDHAAEGKIKDLVTGDFHFVEFKGKEPVKIRNYVRVLVTGNPNWLVPAGFFVLGMIDLPTAVALPLVVVRENLDKLNVTVRLDGLRRYWHFHISRSESGSLSLQRARGEPPLPLDRYVVQITG